MKIANVLAILLSGLGLAILVAGPASAGGGGGGGGPCSGFSEGDQLVMRDSCFDGAAHFSESGSSLVIENGGIIPHTYTAVDGSFDTGILQPGESSEILLDKDGVVRVLCTLHGTAHGGGMAGVLLIGESMAAGKAARSPVSAEIGIRSEQGAVESVDSLESVNRIKELLETYAKITMLIVVVTGGLLGLLVIGLVRRSSRSDPDTASAEQASDQVDISA